LILEASLIKKHKPKHNIILREDKNYHYIKVTVQEEWPRVMMDRRKSRDKARYFGPYSSAGSMLGEASADLVALPVAQLQEAELKKRDQRPGRVKLYS